jgi:Chaperone of endosialidase
MKTTILKTMPSTNAKVRTPMNHLFSPRVLFLVPLFIVCFAFLPGAQGQLSPPPDGCYPNFTTAEGCDALNSLTTGSGNTAIGWRSLFLNTDANFNTAVGGRALALNNGDSNTAVGAVALLLNTSGTENTAVGTDALVNNGTGTENTADGAFALFSNIEGMRNTAIGSHALFDTTADSNTAIGADALSASTTGAFNVAIGGSALLNNTEGDNNTVVGVGALSQSTGSGNTALGRLAGANMTTADNVICIGSPGDGTAFATSDRCYIGNIRGVIVGNLDGINVIVDSDGQLGTSNSSRRFKKDIKPMDQTSEAILALKPVTFHYKNADTKKAGETPQFGLIAEDVADVNPDLVVRDADGEPFTVRYDAVNAMLLNEFLKEHKKVEEQQTNITQLNSKLASQAAIIAQQQKGMEVLTAQLKEQAAQIQKVSAQVELNRSATRTVAIPQ